MIDSKAIQNIIRKQKWLSTSELLAELENIGILHYTGQPKIMGFGSHGNGANFCISDGIIASVPDAPHHGTIPIFMDFTYAIQYIGTRNIEATSVTIFIYKSIRGYKKGLKSEIIRGLQWILNDLEVMISGR